VRSIPALLLSLIALLFATAGHAASHYCPEFLANPDAPEPSHRGELTFSPYTHHWNYNPAHKHVLLLALDEQLPGGRLCGISLFSNSFGQPSTYVYAGQQFKQLFGQPNLFAKVSAGILYGYVGHYRDKVPLNYRGFSPAVIPSVGYQFSARDSAQLQVLGTAGVMLSFGRHF
jgi:hypothetical protein